MEAQKVFKKTVKSIVLKVQKSDAPKNKSQDDYRGYRDDYHDNYPEDYHDYHNDYRDDYNLKH